MGNYVKNLRILSDLCRQLDIEPQEIAVIEYQDINLDNARITLGVKGLGLKLYESYGLKDELDELRFQYNVLQKLPGQIVQKPIASPVQMNLSGNCLYGQLFIPIKGLVCSLATENHLRKCGRWLAHLHKAVDETALVKTYKKTARSENLLIDMLTIVHNNLEADRLLDNHLQTIRESIIYIERYEPFFNAQSRYFTPYGSLENNCWIDTGDYVVNPYFTYKSKCSQVWDIACVLQSIQSADLIFSFIDSYFENGGKPFTGLELMLNIFLLRLHKLIAMSFDKDKADITTMKIEAFADGWCTDLLGNRPFTVSSIPAELFNRLGINGL